MGHDPGDRMKISSDMLYIIHLFGLKIFEIEFVMKFNDIWPFCPSPGA